MLKRNIAIDYHASKLFIAVIAGLLLFLSVSLVAGNVKPTQLERDMAFLEMSYLPALMTSKEAEPEKALKTALKFQGNFKAFSDKYAPTDPVWKEHLERITPHINNAVKSIKAKGPDQMSHDELEQYRLIMMDLRIKKGIYSFMDLLTDFHGTMEVLVEKSSNPSAKIDWALLSDLNGKAVLSWNKVLAGKFDGNLYRMNSQKTEVFKAALLRVQERLTDLEKTIDSRDEKQLPGAGQTVKSAFKNTVRKFMD